MTQHPGPLELCLAGQISPEVALARLLLGGASAADMAARVAQLPPTWAQAALQRLLAGRAETLDRLAAEIAATEGDHASLVATPEDGAARVAEFFDRAVAHSPEASVALYSLGDPAILAAATAEITQWLAAEKLLRPAADVLDLGCGIGRIAASLAHCCRSVLGLDVSAGMVAEARRRHERLAHLRFQTTPGRDLDALPPSAFDLVLAIDSFPYIVQTGMEAARRHVAGSARALRPGGALVILNLSYRGNLEADRADAAAWATESGLTLTQDGTHPFALWDAAAFVLHRPG